MTLTLTPSPCPIEAKAAQIAGLVFATNWDTKERARLQALLVELVAEARRGAVEDMRAEMRT